jgi:DHA1 family multidrug resistance protein-like MFS transporter
MEKKPPLLTRTLVILLFGMILANIGGNMYGPLLPLYVQSLGADVSRVGIFFTLSMIAPLLFQILGGWLSDSIGRVKAMAIGSVAGLAGYVVFAVAPSWGWLLLGTIGLSIATSTVGPSFQAFVAEESSEANRGKVYGIVQGAFQVVGVIGAPLGGLIADKYGFRSMFLVATGLYFAATVLRLVMARNVVKKETTPAAAPSFGQLKTSLIAILGLLTAGGIVTWIFISDGIGDVSFSVVGNLFPLYMNNIIGLTKTQIGLLGAVSSIAMMLFITLGGILSDKRGERVGIVLGYALIGLAIFAMINVKSFYAFIGAWALLGVGQALIGPAYSSLISKVVPQNLRGTAFGFFSTSLGVISLPAPYIGAMLWEKFGPTVPFYVPMVTLFIILPIIWFKFKLPKPPKDAGQVPGPENVAGDNVQPAPVAESPVK